ncbi:MAG: hypothetical protein IPN71_18110 [Fibrobacteres bacterium]|nr:hypothetical protein [Fibrobacterota bacterium]
MKKSLPFLALIAAFVFASARPAEAKAGIPIFWSSGTEKIVKVADFPDTGDFKIDANENLDPGYKFKQVQLFWLPLWNYGGEWCGYVGKDDTYLEIPKATLDSLAKSVNVTLPDSPSLGLWNTIGGKLIVVLLLVGAIGVFFLKNSDD